MPVTTTTHISGFILGLKKARGIKFQRALLFARSRHEAWRSVSKGFEVVEPLSLKKPRGVVR